jgi:hypothetical protein
MHVLSVNKIGDCINVEIGREEDVVLTAPNEVGKLVQQIMYMYSGGLKRRVVKASICLSEDEYEILQPAVGDEANIQTTNDKIIIELKR